jgi:hypothetical protein
VSTTKQSITSAETSLNQIPAAFKLINAAARMPEAFWARTHDVLDYGGGKYDTFTDFLARMHIRNWVYDPFNRSEEHNALVRKLLTARPADVAICSNVLNVVKEPAVRRAILEDIRDLVESAGSVFIVVYEGDRSSRGRKTSKGWQANRPTRNYLREVRKVFPGAHVCRGGKLIYAEVPLPTT